RQIIGAEYSVRQGAGPELSVVESFSRDAESSERSAARGPAPRCAAASRLHAGDRRMVKACVDVDYRGDDAVAACVLFRNWADPAPAGQLVPLVRGVPA